MIAQILDPVGIAAEKRPLDYLSVDMLQTVANLETRPCNCRLAQLFLATMIRQHLHDIA